MAVKIESVVDKTRPGTTYYQIIADSPEEIDIAVLKLADSFKDGVAEFDKLLTNGKEFCKFGIIVRQTEH